MAETLIPGRPGTVVADGGRMKDWTSIVRVRSVFGRVAASTLNTLIERCAQEGTELETLLESGHQNGPLRVCAVPVWGPDSVHAVQAWVGPVAEQAPPRRAVGAWVWNPVTQRSVNGPDAEQQIFGVAPENVRPERTATENFGRVIRFDDMLGYVSFSDIAPDGAHWQGHLSAVRDDGAVRVLQAAARMRRTDVAWVHGLFHDITDVQQHVPLLDSTALRAVVAKSRSAGLGTVALAAAVVYDWHGCPAPPVDQWLVETPEWCGHGHQDFLDACARMTAGSESEKFTARIRFTGGEWIDVTLAMTILTRELTPQALLEVTVGH